MISTLLIGLIAGTTAVLFIQWDAYGHDKTGFFTNHPGVGVGVVVAAGIVAVWIRSKIV